MATKIVQRRSILRQSQDQASRIDGQFKSLFKLAIRQFTHFSGIILAVLNDMLEEIMRHQTNCSIGVLHLFLIRAW